MDEDYYDWVEDDSEDIKFNVSMSALFAIAILVTFYLGISVGFCICYYKNRKNMLV